MAENFISAVHFGLFLFFIIVGVIIAVLYKSRMDLYINEDKISEDKLKLMQNKNKKKIIIIFVSILLLLASIKLLYYYSPKNILIIQFFIIIFVVYLCLTLNIYLHIYFLIRKKLRYPWFFD